MRLFSVRPKQELRNYFRGNFEQSSLRIVIISRCQDLFERAVASPRSFIIGHEVAYDFLITGAGVFWRSCVLGFETAFVKSLVVVISLRVQIAGAMFQ